MDIIPKTLTRNQIVNAQFHRRELVSSLQGVPVRRATYTGMCHNHHGCLVPNPPGFASLDALYSVPGDHDVARPRFDQSLGTGWQKSPTPRLCQPQNPHHLHYCGCAFKPFACLRCQAPGQLPVLKAVSIFTRIGRPGLTFKSCSPLPTSLLWRLSSTFRST